MDKKKIGIIALLSIIVLISMLFIIDSVVTNNKTHIIRFEDNGVLLNTYKIKNNDKIEKPTDPIKDNYLFDYWSYKGEEYNFDTKVTEDITLIANYIENNLFYTVTFISDNFKQEVEVKANEKVDSLNPSEKPNYLFDYWSYNNEVFNFDTSITDNITLTAVWVLESEVEEYFVVTFNNNGNINTQKVLPNRTVNKIPLYDTESHNFDYWSYNNLEYDFNTIVTKDITLIAKWSIKTYQIIFSSNGSIVEPQTVNYGEKIVQPSNPTYGNREFLYWSYNNVEYDFNTEVYKDMVLIANFSKIRYEVTFDTDNGTEIESQLVDEDKLVQVPAKPIKEGYEFLYWEYNNEQYLFNKVLTEDITLKAVYQLITNETVYHTVTFNASGGDSVDYQVVVHGAVALEVVTTQLNYDFVYWMYNNQEFDFNTRITENITLVAKWQLHSFKVVFNSNQGSLIDTQIVDMYSKATYKEPTLYDHIFLYWAVEETNEEYDFNSQVVSNIKLVAVWEKVVRYNIEFQTEGGSSVDEQSIIKGNSVSIPYAPVKENYVFAYWTYNDEQYDFTTQITEDIVLVASWISVEQILITFDTNGGSHIDDQIIDNLSYIEAPQSPTKLNHDFICWELDGKQYDFGQLVTKNITLTAKWFYVEPITYYSITYISNSAVYKTEQVIANQTASSFSMSVTTTHRFNSWQYSNGKEFAFTDKITEDITLYAFWDERIYYDITYDLDGGSFSNTSHVYQVEQGYKPTSFTNPTKPFHKFVEWQLPNGEKYTFNSLATYSNISVKAIWEISNLTIDYIDATKVYNSYSTTFNITGTPPTGVTIQYTPTNVFTHVGVYTVTANAYYEGAIIWSKDATYTITPYTVTLSYTGDFLYEYSGTSLVPNVDVAVSTFCYYDRQTPSKRGDITFEYVTNMTSVGIHTVTTVLILNGEYNANYILNNDTFDIEIMAVRQYNFDYEVVDDEIRILGFYNSLQTDLVIPSTINNKPVTTIASKAFYQNTNLVSFTLPDTIKTIESQAFYKCTNLTTVNLGANLEYIGNEAFYYCQKLTDVTYGTKLKEIGTSAFYYCTTLSFITTANQVTTIGASAFYNCQKLTTLPVGNSIETIGNSAFRYCTSLTQITLSNTLITLGTHVFANCTKLSSITLSQNLTTIGINAFQECTALTSITIPNSVVTMDKYAFYKCSNLLSVVLSNSLTTISDYAFDYCTKLSSVTFPTTGNLVTIGSYAFRYTALETLNLPNSIKTINSYAFFNITELSTVTIPDSVTTFGSGIFQNCTGLTSYKLPTNMQTIPTSIFQGCTGFTTITIPKSITTIGSSAFSGCTNVENITFESSNTIETIGDSAFYNFKNMSKFTIPISVTTLGATVFYGWTSLSAITIPASTTKLGNGVFTNCTSLTSMVIPNTIETMGTAMFQGCTNLSIVTINASLTTLPGSTFYNCSSLSTVILPAGLTVIGYQSFYGCKSLTSFSIPSTVTTIQYGAFRYCTGLSSIVIPQTVTSVTYSSYSNYAFANTPDLIIYVSWEEGFRPSGWSSAWQNGCTIRYGYN